MPKDYPSVILPPIWREAIEMPPVYPSSAPLVCFQEYKKNFRYTFLFSYFTNLDFLLILPPIWREAIVMPSVYPSSAPLICFQENKKDFRYTFLFSYFLV